MTSHTEQHQFLQVLDRDEAEARFRRALVLTALEAETVPLDAALGRVLAHDVSAPIDVPGFDRSDYDGFAICASDSWHADELNPRDVSLLSDHSLPGRPATREIRPGTALPIATGGVLPRGADAVMMIEDSVVTGRKLSLRRSVSSGFGVTFAGTDMARGETVLWQGQLLTSRETGVLAALGVTAVPVRRRPQVAILSTGDELVPPGTPLTDGQVYDSNAQIVADAVTELGGIPWRLGIVRDDLDDLRQRLQQAIQQADVVVLSGGTSKGAGDLSFRAVRELNDPGIVVHGVALKPGKPICLAVTAGKPVVVLPGFPTSAIFTFHEFVAPVIRQLAGGGNSPPDQLVAELAVPLRSDPGRTEFNLVRLLPNTHVAATAHPWLAFPIGKGSGSVTAFSQADGFLKIDQHVELVEPHAKVHVTLLSRRLELPDLVVIGSHCVGVEWLLTQLRAQGWRTSYLAVGSTAGMRAAEQGACDLAGIHLLDPATNCYNMHLASDRVAIHRGYQRQQGIVFRRDDQRFAKRTLRQLMAAIVDADDVVMVNRNPGSGTRIVIEHLLAGCQPRGYSVAARTHAAVAAAVQQGRADWGVTIGWYAEAYDLDFLPVRAEHFDFAIPRERADRPVVAEFLRILQQPETRQIMAAMGLKLFLMRSSAS